MRMAFMAVIMADRFVGDLGRVFLMVVPGTAVAARTHRKHGHDTYDILIHHCLFFLQN